MSKEAISIAIIVIFLAAVFAYAVPLQVHAATPTFGNVIEVNGQKLGTMVASGNDIYVMWGESKILPDGTVVGTDIFVRKITNDGSTIGPQVQVVHMDIDNRLGSQITVLQNPSITVSGNTVYVTWLQTTITVRGPNVSDPHIPPKFDLFLKRSTDSGLTFGDAINLSNSGGVQGNYDVVTHNNNVYVTWVDSSLGNDEVFFRASNDSGATWNPRINLSNNAGRSAIQGGSIAVSGNNVYIVWQDSTPRQLGILLRVSNDYGNAFGPVVNLGEKGLSYRPVVATSGSNVYVAGLNSPDPQNSDDRYLNLVASHDNGASFGDAVNISNSGKSEFPIMRASGNRVYISWVDIQGPSFIGWEVFFRVSTDAGSTFKPAVNLSGKIFNQPGHKLIAYGSSVYVAWSADSRSLLRVSNDGGLTFEERIDVSNGATQGGPVMLLSDNKLYLAWISKSGMSFRVATLPPVSGEITIDPIANTKSRWGVDDVLVSGTVTGALVTDSIEIDWGDGTTVAGISHSNEKWGLFAHSYTSRSVGQKDVVVRLLDSNGFEKARTSQTIVVQKHRTVIGIEPVSSVEAGSLVTVEGMLIDQEIGKGIGGKLIAFNGTGSAGIGVTTANSTKGAVTNGEGRFSAMGESPTEAGSWIVQIFFAGDEHYLPSNITVRYDTTKPVTDSKESGIERKDSASQGITMEMKQNDKLIFVNVKNNEEHKIYGFQLKSNDGTIRFVKAFGWDRDRIDKSTVLIDTNGSPVMPDGNFKILLIMDNPSAPLEWSALDEHGVEISKGLIT